MLSKTQIDRLGERLKQGPVAEADLRLLDEYGASFSAPYVEVVLILTGLGFRPTGRERKSNQSIVDKLRRESIRLTQIQDIAGCRLVVPGVAEQVSAVESVTSTLAPARLIDRRVSPSYGYRAVHVVVDRGGMFVEVQIRTALQHYWAASSEKLADEFGHGLKYGQGPPALAAALQQWSASIREWEEWLGARAAAGEVTLREQTRIEAVHQHAIHGQADVLAIAHELRKNRDSEGGPK